MQSTLRLARRRHWRGLLRFTPLSGILALGLVWFTMAILEARTEQPVGEVDGGISLESNDGTFVLRYSSEPETIPWGERFSIDVSVARADGEPLQATLAVDARMPDHGHGMNREPKLERLNGSSWRVTNLLFHMPGYWEVYFDLTRGAVTERAQFSVEID
jgi:hypothetical protein